MQLINEIACYITNCIRKRYLRFYYYYRVHTSDGELWVHWRSQCFGTDMVYRIPLLYECTVSKQCNYY